jgi:hypothetical protein
MLLNLQQETDVNKARDKLEHFIKTGKTIDLIEKMNTRTTTQNSALHLLFSIITNQLNEMGLEYHYYGLKQQLITTRYNERIVKEFLWKPIQRTLFDIESTTKINTIQINEIMDVLIKWFGEKGVVIQFPSKEQLNKLIK